jgi:hypothetical protein
MDIFFHRRPSTLNDSYLFAVKSYVMSACSSTEIQGIAVATSARYKFCPVSSSFKGSLFYLHFLCAQKQTKGHLVFKPGPINLQIEAVDCAKGERNAWQTTASDCDLSVAFSAGPVLAERAGEDLGRSASLQAGILRGLWDDLKAH